MRRPDTRLAFGPLPARPTAPTRNRIVRLPIILSLCLAVALAAPPSFAADAKPADKPAGPTVPEPEAIKWPRIKTWYKPGQEAEAIRAAKLLGRPIAIAWYVEKRSKSSLARWKKSDVAKYFVGFSVTEKATGVTQEGKLQYAMTHPLVKRIHEASGVGEVKAPCLFMATWKGDYLGVIPRRIKDAKVINTTARDAVKKYGKLVQVSQVRSGWKNLMAGRRLWRDGKHDAAMKHYRKVMALANMNPRMGIVTELNKDGLAINHRGAPLLSAAQGQYGRGELDKAEETVRQIHKRYRGFWVAKQAKIIFDNIRTARQEKVAAAKAAKKNPVEKPAAKPPAKPAADGKRKVNDKKDEGGGDKNGEEDEEYEDDF